MSVFSYAALSGNSYVIDKGGTASSTVYKSFTDFVSDLSKGTRADGGTANGPGVSGPVTVTFKSGSGPYTEQISIPAISGASKTNTITIDGNGQTLTFNTTSSSKFAVLQLDGADWFVVKNMTIISTGTSYGRCVHLKNAADNNVFDKLTMSMPNMTSTSNYNAYFMICNSETAP
ncbi:MAG: hypothetical protein H6606_11225, partial [Flavobacteriales bacterium]|nr:hypothetical protein [Flavobacteriales bacterium]